MLMVPAHTLNSFKPSQGAATWETSLKCLKPLGTMLSFGSASGEVGNHSF